MKLLFLLFAVTGLVVGWSSRTYTQSDPCSLNTVIASFQAAALSEEIDTWLKRYEESECSRGVVRAAQYFARGYESYFNEFDEHSIPLSWAGTGQGVLSYRGTLSVYLGHYPDVGVIFTRFQDGRFGGTVRLGSHTASIPGTYYTSELDLPQPVLWDVIIGCDPDSVVAWLKWITSDPGTEGILRGLLNVAVITNDNRMCAAAYDSSTGGHKVVDWVLSSQK